MNTRSRSANRRAGASHTLEHTMHVFHAKQRWIHLMMSLVCVPNEMYHISKAIKQLSAKLVIATLNSNYSLVAFLPMIRKIADDDTITSLTNKQEVTTQILMADTFQATYTYNHQ